MTSLSETLPILDQAVPALPGKVDAVARRSDAFDEAARAAIAMFGQRRAQAEALVGQALRVLEALRDQSSEDRQRVEGAAQELHDAAEREAHSVEEGVQDLEAAGDAAESALAALESRLAQDGDRMRSVHEEAQAPLEELVDLIESSRSELAAAAEGMTAAVRSAPEAIAAGHALVGEGVAALVDAMRRMVEAAQGRLQKTLTYLDEVRSEQEAALCDALSHLEDQRGQLEQELSGRMERDVREALDPELETLAGALGEMGQQVVRLQVDCRMRREELEQQLAAVSERIPPLESGAIQVKQAADRVGIAWR